MVNFIEASDVKFGAHLNASISFDETIYKLQMPADRESLIDSAMLVLEESGLGKFSEVELNKKLSGKIVSLSPYIHALT